MIFNGVRLPDEIRIALEEGRLAVFVGAGVSCPPPSNLPAFNGLASQIAGGKAVERGREDRFLGELARNGTDVHAAAARILYNETTKPTQLHSELIRLFGSAEKVRIITTNFDDHFSTAAKTVFRKGNLREYYAPALPLGDNFSGLVYLHGSARLNLRELVLTDKDFGAAYLTRGWARDFLVPLFSKYTVVFVGYSHSDVTTSYLARGLNQSEIKDRWTLVPSDSDNNVRDNWAHLEISATDYPVDRADKENSHRALTSFFSAWADHTHESLFSRAKRVRAIARGLPPENETESQYLSYCLRHPRIASDFCSAIRHPAWIGWMYAQGYFKPFFGDAALPADWREGPNWAIAQWLCYRVRCEHPELLLDLIEKNGRRLSRDFSKLFSRVLWGEQRKAPDPKFAVWVSVLLAQGKEAADEDIWAYLLSVCEIPEHAGIALRLFELLSTPEIRIEKTWDFGKPAGEKAAAEKPAGLKADYRITWPTAATHWLRKAWKDIFESHLPEVAEPLAQVVTKQIGMAHLLLRDVGRATEQHDRLSWSRISIEAHEQDDGPLEECFSCLIDILREILVLWIRTNPARARVQMNIWWDSRMPLLRRFALHALNVDPQYLPEERIRWVLRKDLLFKSEMKKEVFDLLASAYPKVTTATRRRLLRRVSRGYRGSGEKNMSAISVAYQKFNVLVWLERSDPACAMVKEEVAKIRDAHPEFGEREHPSLNRWHGKARFIDPKEGFDFDKILTEPPEQYLESLTKAKGESADRDRWTYLSNLAVLFSRSRDWGQKLMESLSRQEETDEAIWTPVFSAWKDVLKLDEDWNWILSLAENLPANRAVSSAIAQLIAGNVWNKDVALSAVTIDRAAILVDRAWELCSSLPEPLDDNYRDWLTTAINHVGGSIGEFWVHYCSNLRHRPNAEWKGVPVQIKNRIREALDGTTRAKVYARIALTPWMGFFFAWDQEFAVRNFLPLLDWKRDPVVAQQTWSVLLNYDRRQTLEIEEILMPYYRQFADRLMPLLKGASENSEQFGSTARQNLGFRLAVQATRVIADPVESGFFRDYLPLLPDEIRGALAQGILNHLENIDDEARKSLWEVWLKRYVELRLIGLPVALSYAETKHMLDWCLELGPVFPEAVELICQMPQKEFFAYSVVQDLLDNPVLQKFPVHACRLANTALQAESHPLLHDELLSLHGRLKAVISGTVEFNAFEELLYLRGWQKK